MTSGDNKFIPVIPSEARTLLKNGVPTSARLSIWTPGQTHGYMSRIHRVYDQLGTLFIAVTKHDQEGDDFEQSITREGTETCLFALHLPTELVYFKADLRRSEPGALNFKINEPVYKLQRRRSLRIPSPSTNAVEVKFYLDGAPEKVMAMRLVNIGDGGIGLMFANKEEFTAIKVGAAILGINFKLEGMEVHADGILRHTSELPGKKVKDRYRWGIQYTNIESRLQERISRFVMEMATQFYGRM